MSDYGSQPQGPYGQSPQNAPSAQRPSAPAGTPVSVGDSAQLTMIAGYVGAGLGVLTFIWGFLNWFTSGSEGVGGYSQQGAGASAVVGLSLAAGLIAAGAAFEKKSASITPTALALAAFLVSLGIIIGKSSIGPNASIGAGIGLILALITTILQTAALGYVWLLESGRMSAPAKSPKPQQNQWSGPPSGGPYGGPSQGGPQGGYGGNPPGGAYPGAGQYQSPPAPPSYQSPGQYGPPQASPQGSPQSPQQPPPPSNPYGPPPGGYGAPGQSPQGAGGPSQSGSTSSMPAQGSNPYQPPSQPSSSSDESGGGYGEATRHIPRYPGSDSEQGS